MVVTVTLNPCIDKTVEIERLTLDGTNQILESRSDISGKGINVSIVLRHLGEETLAMGFNYTGEHAPLASFMEACGVPNLLVDVPGTLRTNLKIFNRETHSMTEYNEGGGPVSHAELQAFFSAFSSQLDRMGPNDFLVLDGSVPPGVPQDIYRRLILEAKKHHISAVLDAHGALLQEGFAAAPYAVKPNLSEFEEAVGRKLSSIPDIHSAAQPLLTQGTHYVCISLGGSGAVLISPDGCWYSPALTDIEVRGLQGAGDSLVAGICMAAGRNLPAPEVLRYAMAAANGSVCHEGTQLCSRVEFDNFLPRIQVEKIDLASCEYQQRGAALCRS